MNEKSKPEAILEGEKAFLNLSEPDKLKSKYPQASPYESGTNNFFYFNEGYSVAAHDFFYKKYNLYEFIEQINDVCREFNVHLNFGCGCCGAGAIVENYEFDFKN